ncbi:MAG: lipopolysaccharide heptosyltransferase I [Vicinamibacterales bacterium]
MNRFLIVRLGSLGDVVHGIPVAAALRAEYPNARIDWMVDPRYIELLNLVTCLDRRIPVDPRGIYRGGRGRFRQTLAELRRVRYDAVIDLQGLLKSAVLARLVRAQQTIGFPREHLREPLARFFYTHTPVPESTHVVHKNLALLAPLQIHDRRLSFPIEIPRTPTVEAVIERFGGYALINPGAAWPNKRWPPDRFGQLARGIFEQFGMRSVVLWGPGEQPLAQAVAAAAGGAADVSPPTSIPDLVGLARGAQLMISGDTGPLHVAGAVGTPIVALFGPTYAERNGPWGMFDITVSRTEQCICHYQRQCRRDTPCIEDIRVDDVLAAVRRRMGLH